MQMVYKESSDQEQDRHSVSPPPKQIVRENYILGYFQHEVIFENEAIERWLDDGGTEGRKSTEVE